MTEPLPPWEIASNGGTRRPWFIQRKGADRGNWPGGSHLWYLEDGRGALIRFGSHVTAQRRADSLNRGEAQC